MRYRLFQCASHLLLCWHSLRIFSAHERYNVIIRVFVKPDAMLLQPGVRTQRHLLLGITTQLFCRWSINPYCSFLFLHIIRAITIPPSRLAVTRNIPEPIHSSTRRRHSAMLRVPSLAILGIPSGGRTRTVTIDVRGVGRVALAVKLVGLGVHGQSVRVVDSLDGAAALEEGAEATGFLAVAACVVVGGRRAEALLLLAVAAKTKFGKGGDDEEDAVSRIRVSDSSHDISSTDSSGWFFLVRFLGWGGVELTSLQ